VRAPIVVSAVVALGAVAVSLSAPSAHAAALTSGAAVSAVAEQSGVTKVQYWDGRRGYHYRGGYHRHRGAGRGVGPFLGGLAAGAIVGGALSRGYSYDGGGGGDGMARCAATFRSFNPSTGTYTTYGGETRMCPYL
jgi:hypothetical protein